MKVRRFFALLTSVATFHLSAVGGDAACLTHGTAGHHAVASHGGTPAGHAMDVERHAMPTAHAVEAPVVRASTVATSGGPPCEIPAPRHCCEGLVGCSATGAVTSERDLLVSGVLPAARVREALLDAPASFAPAPEPPPPKA